MANRTILVDNNTWNNTHISRVGQAMASPEDKAYEIMRELDVDYVLVIFGGLTGKVIYEMEIREFFNGTWILISIIDRDNELWAHY